MPLYEMNLIWISVWMSAVTAAVTVPYLIYIIIKKRTPSKTAAIIIAACMLLAAAILGLSLPIEELYWGILPVTFTVQFLYLMYISVKKRTLNRTAAIIWIVWILLAWAISMVMVLST